MRSSLTASPGKRWSWRTDEAPSPKSSIRAATECSSNRRPSTRRAASGSSIIELSATSSRSPRGSSRASASAPVTRSTKPGSASWRWETLTETEMCCPRGCLRQIASWRHASPSTKRPSGRISPVSSAIGTNSRGSIAVPVESVQRHSASKPAMVAGRGLDHRLVEHAQLGALERVAQAGLELQPLHHARVHRLVEHRVASRRPWPWRGTWRRRRRAPRPRARARR